MGAIEMMEMARQEQARRQATTISESWAKKIKTVEEFLSETFPEPGWHVENFIPTQSLVFFAGVPGSYKTFLAIACAFAMREGRNLFDKIDTPKSFGTKTNPANVLFIEEEMNGGIFQTRMRAMSRAEYPKQSNLYVAMSTDFKVAKDGDLSELRKFCVERKIGVVFMDPFSSVLGIDNENDNAKIAPVLGNLRRMIIDDPAVGTSVVMIHHPAKNSTGDGTFLRGGGEILGKADHMVHFERDAVLPKIKVTCEKARQVDKSEVPILEIEFRKKNDLIGLILVGSELPVEAASKDDKEQEKVDQTIRSIRRAFEKLGKSATKEEISAWIKANAQTTTLGTAWFTMIDGGEVEELEDGKFSYKKKTI